MTRHAILVLNLGTPNSPSRKEVKTYLKQFLLDYRVIDKNPLLRNALVRGVIAPFRSKDSAASYQEIWTDRGSPLLYHSQDLVDKLNALTDSNHQFFLGMRYQNPCMVKVLNQIKEWQPDKITLFPMYPQYASATTGSTFELAFDTISRWKTIVSLNTIHAYYNHPSFIDSWKQAFSSFNLNKYDHLLFSFHGLPQSQLKKCDPNNHCLQKPDCCESIANINRQCYSAQCYQTAKLIAQSLDIPTDMYTICFQSRLGREPWTQPYTSDVLKNLAETRKKKILVCSPAFTADCLETIFELGVEYNKLFQEFGGDTLDYVPSLNSNTSWAINILEMLNLDQNSRVKIDRVNTNKGSNLSSV